MKKTVLAFLLFSLLSASNSLAAEKLRIASPVKLSPVYYLPVLAAEEIGFWEKNDIKGEWIAFGSVAAMHQALAAKAIDFGLSTATTEILGASVGLPILIVSDLHPPNQEVNFFIWVRGDSPIRAPKELKGAKLGVSLFRGIEHAYGQLMVKALGLEKEVTFVGTGGILQSLASLKVKGIDGVVLTIHQMVKLKRDGEVRELVSVNDFIPKEWALYDTFAHREFAQKNPAILRKAVRAILQATDFIQKNPAWTLAKIKEMQGYSEEEAKIIYDRLTFTRDGKMNKKGLENVKNFLVEYGIVAKEKAPAIDRLYTEEFLP